MKRQAIVLIVAMILWAVGLARSERESTGRRSPTGSGVAVAQGQIFEKDFGVDKSSLANRGTNPYMILEPGYRLVLSDGKDTLEITVLNETRRVDGVDTRIVEERETQGGRLSEVSRNYFALHPSTGDVYYFGEDVDVYDDAGNIAGHEGSWLSGLNGAHFGLQMPGSPEIGQGFYQELAPGIAMDRARIVSLEETVEVPMGEFDRCLKTEESSGVEEGVEDKLYAPYVGLLREEAFRLDHVEVPKDLSGMPEPVSKTFRAEFPGAKIEKLDVEGEDGLVVYDFEFSEGHDEKETDITGAGTMLERTLVVGPEDLPMPALQAVRKAASGASFGRIEQIEISYRVANGRAVKLPAALTRYAVAWQGERKGEIVVDPEGNIIESE